MNTEESVLQFANRIRQLAGILKSMNVVIPESEMAMAVLNSFPEEYNALISALDAIDEDEINLRFEFIKARIMQEEQRVAIRSKSAEEKSESAALLTTQPNQQSANDRFTRRRPYCNCCKGLGHNESKCWTKFTHLNPPQENKSTSRPALFANQSDEDPTVRLIAKEQALDSEPGFCMMAKYEDAREAKNSGK